jgi:hypothetical protein
MKKNCEQTLQTIFGKDDDYPKQVNQHCSSCRDCSNTAKVWMLLRNNNTEKSPSQELDIKILDLAKNISKRRKQRTTYLRRLLYYSAAASSIAAAYAVTMYPIEQVKCTTPAIIQSWDWSKFESVTLETTAAAEFSHQYIYSSPKRRSDGGAGIIINSEINYQEI